MFGYIQTYSIQMQHILTREKYLYSKLKSEIKESSGILFHVRRRILLFQISAKTIFIWKYGMLLFPDKRQMRRAALQREAADCILQHARCGLEHRS